VEAFLSKKELCGRVHAGLIPHYSSQVAGQRGKMIEGREEEYKNFASELRKKSRDSEWTESEKKLLFDYKILFERIRDKKTLAETGD
jgi:hypothetical protein